MSAANPPSATASPASLPTSSVCFGAASAIAVTPAISAATASIWRTLTDSPSWKWASTSSRTRPTASTGWTTVSGAIVSATICRAKPATASAMPPSQRRRCARVTSSAGRPASSLLTLRASDACSTYENS